MNDETAVKGASGYFARLRRTRVATRLSVIVERGLAAAAAARRRRQPVPQPFLARRLPRAAGHLAAGRGRWCSCSAPLAALYPLRFFRLPRNDEVDRRIERANLLEHTPVRSRPTGRAGDAGSLRPGAVARASEAHGGTARRRRCRSAAHCRARARPVGSARRRRAAARHRLRLFAGPGGGNIGDRVQGKDRCGRAAAAYRCLGDAAGLYRQAADLPGRRSGGRSAPVFTVPEGSDVALRVTGGCGEESLDFIDAAGNSRRFAAEKPGQGSGRGQPSRPPARRCAIRRQARRPTARWR